MRLPVSWTLSIVAALGALSLKANAQARLVTNPDHPPEMAGLYRVESPAAIAPQRIRFLRLFADGNARWETLEIDASTPIVSATVNVAKVSGRRWHLKTLANGRAPQFCYPDVQGEACYAFHAETPGKDLLLFGPDANWGEPTIILRRERASRH